MFNADCFPTATMVTRKRQNNTLYVHCLYCFYCVNHKKNVSMLWGKLVFHLFMSMQKCCQQLRLDCCRKIRSLMNQNLAGRGRGLLYGKIPECVWRKTARHFSRYNLHVEGALNPGYSAYKAAALQNQTPCSIKFSVCRVRIYLHYNFQMRHPCFVANAEIYYKHI